MSAYRIKLLINPSQDGNLKLYVYRSKNQSDIDTIAKVKNLLPVMVIDELTYDQFDPNGKYVAWDTYDSDFWAANGFTYNGPEPVAIPTNEYETEIITNTVNDYTHYYSVRINPLPLEYPGNMYYYSIIGVNQANTLITHLSRVRARLLETNYIGLCVRELQSCDNYTGNPTDVWESVATVSWDTDILIGNVLNTTQYERFGSPFVETVNRFTPDEVTVDTRCALNFNHIYISVPNVWQMNNTRFNFRKLKSFRVRNIFDSHYGDFSIPTFQSILQASIEKMMILREDVTDLSEADRELPTPLDNLNDTLVYSIIRKNGKFYTDSMTTLSYNRYMLNEENGSIGIYSENSVQPNITFKFAAQANTVYRYTFYLEDIYGKRSEPTVVLVRT